MALALLAYGAGVLTILSPCILPVLPFVFARAGRPFLTSTLPMLAGMAVSFAGIASLAAVGGAWAVDANEWGRYAAMAVLAGFGLMLLWPALADRLTRPLVALGGRLSGGEGVGGSVLLGVATGLLWAPCAGPVLGLILTGAALNGANWGTTGLLAAYAAGAATALALAVGAGGRVYRVMRASIGIGEGLRRVAGVLVLVSVAAIAAGLDTGVLTRLSLSGTNRIEETLIGRIAPERGIGPAPGQGAMMAPDPGAMATGQGGAAPTGTTAADAGAADGQGGAGMAATAGQGAMMAANPDAAMAGGQPATAPAADPAAMASGTGAGTIPDAAAGQAALMAGLQDAMIAAGRGAVAASPDAMAPIALPIEGIAPSLDGAVAWLNSPPLTMEALRGKVVLVDFWTYSCINCLRAIPYVRAWAQRYGDQGLVVIGVHSPEFAFERRIGNVETAAAGLDITYPIAIDNDYAIWRAFDNRYWPAHFFIDAEGRIRHHHFGEGDYDRSEAIIRQLLAEAGRPALPATAAPISAEGASAPSDLTEVQSPETYLGYLRASNFAGAGGLAMDQPHDYAPPAALRRNEWGLAGRWTVDGEKAVLAAPPGGIGFRFRARDLHLVLGPGQAGTPIRFQVTIDGQPPGVDHGMDTDADGAGVVREDRLYQLIRQQGPVADHLFEIRFLDPGVEAYAFTFG